MKLQSLYSKNITPKNEKSRICKVCKELLCISRFSSTCNGRKLHRCLTCVASRSLVVAQNKKQREIELAEKLLRSRFK